jgi:divalent metal cation (Fe/Co/Zn/Cd) transporter
MVMKFGHVSLEAYVGVVISLVILKSGFDMMKDTLDDILGSRVDGALTRAVKETVRDREGVFGAYDLTLHSYGPDRLEGSVHIEVPDTMEAGEIDKLSVRISREVYQKHGVVISAVGIYARNTRSQKAIATELEIRKFLQEYRDVIQMHGFYLDEEYRIIKFDVVISFDAEDRMAEYEEIHRRLHEKYPGYHVRINLDADISD